MLQVAICGTLVRANDELHAILAIAVREGQLLNLNPKPWIADTISILNPNGPPRSVVEPALVGKPLPLLGGLPLEGWPLVLSSPYLLPVPSTTHPGGTRDIPCP